MLHFVELAFPSSSWQAFCENFGLFCEKFPKPLEKA